MSAPPPDPTVAAPLLRTKLHAPSRRRGAVDRPRLAVRAPTGERRRLTLVSAPAGFGKTTLLSEWYTGGAGSGTAWLSLDGRDNDPGTFWTYVIAALRTVVPDVGAAALAILETSNGPTDAAVESLVGDLDTLDADVVLVLDDYHVIDAAEIHDAVGFLIDHLPPSVGLVLATRVDPPLPLARLRASGDLVERRAADLRFTPDETARYFNTTMGLALSVVEVGALEARTEGWIAALQLAALSLQGRDDVAGFIESFTGDDRFVVDYLIEEVLDRQPADVRQFLLRTAVLNRLSGSLCDAVTGGTSGRATLERLDRANLFLVPLDDRRHWYRYHHLFADVLRARLLDEQPALVPELHRQAARWWAGEGDLVEAVGHAMAGADVELAAELIELAAPSMQRTRQEGLLRTWLEALPAEIFPPRPVLSLALVGARMATGDMTGVEALLADVEGWLDGGADASGDGGPIVADDEQFARLPAQTAVQRAGLPLYSGDLATATAQADRVLELAAPDDHVRRGAASGLLGLASWSTGDLDLARSRYGAAIDHLTRGAHFADALGCSLGLADLCLAQGHLNDAERACNAGLDLVGAHPGLRGAADMHIGLCEVCIERNDLGRAREHLAAGVALGERAGLPQYPYRWRVAAARLRRAEGDLDGALALLDEAMGRYDTDYSPSVRPVPALEARVRVARGELDAALRWAEQQHLSLADELVYVREFEHLTLARVLVAIEVRDRSDLGAVGLVERLRSAAEAGGRTGVVIECLVLLSLARSATGDRSGALTAVEQALVLAEPEGFVAVFLEAGEPLRTLLRTASFDGVAASRCRVVLAAWSGAEPVPVALGPVDELSSRELDVLRLLRSDLSGPEIARELMVSLNTMRTHTKNIYAKLGVTSRREAVRRADQLGL